MNELHVVLGAGQIGTLLTDRLLAQGHRVRQVRRGTTARPGVEVRSGSLADEAFAIAAMAGASVVYHCVNPAYDRWPAELLPNTRGILRGAVGARLVVLDNLYMYNQRDQHAMSESTPVDPSSKKGELRAEAARVMLEAHKAGDVQVVIGRASDFYGPGAANAHFGERFFTRIFAGKAGECMGDPDQPHSVTYTPDVADGLLTLGAAEDCFGRVWMLPTADAVTPRELTRRFGASLGLKAEIARMPRWVLTMAGWFVPVMRELGEMTYQWESPYRVVDTEFRTRFGGAATSLDVGVEATAAWARASFGPRR